MFLEELIISSYKSHTLFGFILSLIIFFNPLAILIGMISANIPDLDHDFKRSYVVNMVIIGALLSLFLYILNLPIYFGLIILTLGFVFLLSTHRRFTHSLLGILFIGTLLFLLMDFGLKLGHILNVYVNLNIFSGFLSNDLILLFIEIGFLSFLFLNKKLRSIFLGIIFISIILIILGIIPSFKISPIIIFLSIFLGLLSHIILDSFTPRGVKFFIPFSNRDCHKILGILLLFVILFVFVMFNKLIQSFLCYLIV